MTIIYIIAIALLVALVFFSRTKSESIFNVTPDQLNLLIKDKKATLIDVRTPREINQGTIGKPIKIEMGPTMEKKMFKLDKKKNYVLYCRSGSRSMMASKTMVKLGFKNVNNLKGGYLAWSRIN